MNAPAKELVATAIQEGWIKAPGTPVRKGGVPPTDTDSPLTNEEARDGYLECWWRIREIELERLKLDNERLREEMLLLSFERASIVRRH